MRLPGIPGRHVGRFGGQEVANRRLVRFAVIDADGDVDIRIGRLECFYRRFKAGFRRRVRIIEDDG